MNGERSASRVLIATGSALYGRSLTRALNQNNVEAFVLKTADDVTDGLQKNGIDLCLLHDQLGDGSGMDVVEQFARSEAGSRIPLILFSRSADVENRALETGASDFLKIPCRPGEVLSLVEQWVDMARLQGVSSSGDAVDAKVTVDEAKAHILLVDDSSLIHQFVGTILEENQYAVTHAFDGLEGLKAATEHKPDLIISDIDMPNMNGYEMCGQIKQKEETDQIPILMLSARGSGVDIDRGFDVGANDFLTKPVTETELLSRIEHVLGGGGGSKREKILVVEDSAMQRNVIVQGLVQQGFSVLDAENGKIGLDIAMAEIPDLVVTDSEMPVMNGRDLTRAIREHEILNDIPVLMLTAADCDVNRAKGEHAGVSAYLTKPFVPDKVVVIAEKLIGERRLVRERQAMQHYMSSSAASAAAAAADQVGNVDDIMRAETRFMTIFFSDIVGFTPLTERMPPDELVGVLNEYFDTMAPIFKRNGGVIDKYVGDAIMALFVGEDGEQSDRDAAYNAIRTGVEMLEALESFNRDLPDPVNIRIGINSGDVVMGDIGSRLYRRDYTVIGDNVNIAARLETSAEHGSIFASKATYDLVSDRVEARDVGPVTVKGKREPIAVYQISRLTDPRGGSA